MDTQTDNPFPIVTEGQIGDSLVQTVDGRDLHRCLKVGKVFRAWIVDRIQQYGFIEGVDYVTFEDLSRPNSDAANSRAQRTKEYALTLDMGKELGMVERNEEGRRIRKYFIECERRVLQAIPAELAEMIRRDDGISRMLARKVTGIEGALTLLSSSMTALASIVQPNQPILIRHGRTAGQIWRENGFPPIKVTCWFSNRLVAMGCEVDGKGRAEVGGRTYKMFDPDKASNWLANGGRALVQEYVAKRQGQKVLRLVPKSEPITERETAR